MSIARRLKSVFALIVAVLGSSAAVAADRPNIIFILADDLGYKDTGFTGAEFYETPNLDALARAGMIFDRAYTCGPNCAPTRACLISGMYTPRHRIYTPGGVSKGAREYMKLVVPARGRKSLDFLPTADALEPDVISVAQVLKRAGYATAHFGKWHLGNDRRGFDLDGSDGEPGKRKMHYGDRTVADRLTDAAIRFVEANKERPFFLYLSHWDVHTPLRATPDVVARYRKKLDDHDADWRPVYAAMVEALDESVGRLMTALDTLGLRKKTLVVFTSDNGGLPKVTSNAPLRGGKGSLFEGGVRVPTCMTWPGVVEAGSRNDVPITSVDFLPTFAELAGAPPPENQPVDGISLAPLLRGQPVERDRSIFWYFPLYLVGGRGGQVLPVYGTNELYWRAVPAAVVMHGDWKLFRYFENDSLELYDLGADVGETRNLGPTETETVKRLRAELDAWLRETGAPIPTRINPNFDNRKVDAAAGAKRADSEEGAQSVAPR